jgi:hypothetical protein
MATYNITRLTNSKKKSIRKFNKFWNLLVKYKYITVR